MVSLWMAIAVCLPAIAGCGVAILVYRRGIRALWREFQEHKTDDRRAVADALTEAQALAGALLALRYGLRAPVRFAAQHGEDLVVWRFFNGRRDGVFLDVGAYDGVSFSNTLALEELGWTGVLVEANPQQAERCARNRPVSRVVNAAVGGPESRGSALFVVATNRQTGCEMLSAMDPSPAHRARCEREGCETTEQRVHYRSCAEILHEAGVSRLDFVSIDVEGGELQALRGLDLDRFRPELVVVEGANPGSPSADFLRSHGYRHVLSRSGNDFFAGALAAGAPPQGCQVPRWPGAGAAAARPS